MNPLQQLDTVLTWLAAAQWDFKSVGTVMVEMNNQFDELTLALILSKLARDNYAEVKYANLHGDAPAYKISFEGRLFNESGGYRRQNADNQLRLDRVRIENDQNQLN